MYGLPKSIYVNEREFPITNNGDFRVVLGCFEALNDEELSEDNRVLASLLIFYNEFNNISDIMRFKDDLKQLIEQMYLFFNCGQKDSPGAVTSKPLIDWEKDCQMICAGINNVAKIEVRSLEYLHWWTFMGYFSSIGESVMSTVVGIRNKIIKHKKLEKYEEEFRRENPQYFIWKSTTVEERDTENLIRNLWNNGGE